MTRTSRLKVYGDYRSWQLPDINDDYDKNTGVEHNPGLEPLTPMDKDYNDMLIGEQLEADNKEAEDKYLNAELIFDVGTNNERRGQVIKRARGLDGEPLGHAHAILLFDT
jgi:hypothetical protein